MTDRLIPAQTDGRVTLPGSDEAFVVPSGQAVQLHEVIVDQPSPAAAIYRFRFLAPAIARGGGTMDFEASIADMQHLCDSYALLQIRPPMPAAAQVIIAFSDMMLPFGETNPEATQFFVAFSIVDGRCVLEPF
jgi:Family of unknown function (DUF6497)